MGEIHVKPGVEFTVIAPAGVRILEHLKQIIKPCAFDITITSACDGEHSGPLDPHRTGEALDIRTHNLTPAQSTFLLESIKALGGRFYAFLESPGTPNEHIHCQRARSTTYTIEDYFRNC